MNYQETNTVKLSISGEIMISTKVKKLVQHAYQTVPFYMNIAREKSIDLNEWLELPITHKNDLARIIHGSITTHKICRSYHYNYA